MINIIINSCGSGGRKVFFGFFAAKHLAACEDRYYRLYQEEYSRIKKLIQEAKGEFLEAHDMFPTESRLGLMAKQCHRNGGTVPEYNRYAYNHTIVVEIAKQKPAMI